jgi:hypothetical protein
MPIGFWAISRKDIMQLVDVNCKRQYGKLPQHTPKYYTLIDKICRTLPQTLETATEEYVCDGILNTYTFPLGEGDF